MKKKYNLLTVPLLALFFISFFTSVYRILPGVRATYVEGTITQDTDWTLVDSPFVLSNDVDVKPGATLTLEPGVEVRFGGNFSLIIEGRVVADGSSERKILFTTNDPTHKVTWGTILLTGSQTSSFTNCIIEYGTNGITVNSGSVLAINNEIASNGMSGIHIAGGTQVTVESNVIRANEDGIALTGDLTGTIDVRQNNISSNTRSGILLESNLYDTSRITKNNILTNNFGFLVRTDTSTYITRNYISNNAIGIYYENGNGHEAHYNDIWGNTLGMDVSSAATVSATHNYWGHRSGPLHPSLNPEGKGNPVGGDGANLDFIFFLTAPIDYSNLVPTANLWTDKILVAPNQNVMFIGADSYDDGRVDRYLFDFGDGTNTGWTTLSIFNHAYSSVQPYSASLWVTDDFDVISQVATTTITVQDLAALSVSMTVSNDTVHSNENVSVSVYVSNGQNAVENVNVTLFSIKGGIFSPTSGLTDSTGHFDATFAPPDVTDVPYTRIIARATADGYADGSDHRDLKVLPPLVPRVLAVDITAESLATVSEAKVNVTVSVSYDTVPVENATVIIASEDGGAFSQPTDVTDAQGTANFVLTAAQVNSPLNATLSARASKTGYADGQNYLIITINPRSLSVQVEPSFASVTSGKSVNVTVYVASDRTPVANAQVTVSADAGDFSSTTELTDSNGNCTFVFNAPRTTVQLAVAITANVSKNGYTSNGNQTVLDIIPETGGWPLMTVLLIVIPIVIVVVIVVLLVKLGIIVVYVKEEEQEEQE